ncbi:hypothetical protein H6P81_020126 [Aristolochia fimbriata]|uniref:Cytochrome P450 n=1 Tax=Aristolochia fimbriata TaxID=158543 RepID=A0AAV7DWU8_ARIFI|nr:hypothetical protein H6P81_020126 [Aristolochia fimbriata]
MEMEESLLSDQQPILAALSSFFIFLFSLIWIFQGRKKTRRGDSAPPEVPGRWPIIGHLRKLAGDRQPLMRTLSHLADKHGPLITLWIGSHRTVVVSSSELAKECYTTNDRVLATRPRSTAGKYLGYGNDHAMLGFSPYGAFWRESRKIATVRLLSGRQLELLKHVRATEVRRSVRHLFEQWVGNGKAPVKIEMQGWFEDLVFNNVMMAVASKRYSGTAGSDSAKDEMEARRFRGLLNDFSLLGGSPIPSDAIPVLEWFDIGGYIKAMKKTMKGLDSLCSNWLEEHRVRRQLSAGKNDTGPDQDFFDVLLTTLEKSHFPNLDPSTFVKALSLSMVLAGSDTTSITLTWALSLLLNNRDALKKAQEELDAYVGKDRNVTEEDIPNLPYLQAIVKETVRLYPAAPVAVPHEAMEDCCVGGYRIPAGTRVLINLWKIHRDPRLWTDPLQFKPERFLTTNADTDVRGQNFELIPFGSGRRMCPGISFALKLAHLILARLLHSFDLHTPLDEPVDMSETPGLSIPKATPLEVLLVPRLESDLYL